MTQQHIYDLVQPISIGNIVFAFKWILFYFGYMFLCSKFLPGRVHQGFKTTEGKILTYKLTGFLVFLQTPILILLSMKFQGFTLRPLITHFWSFFVAATIFSFIVSAILLVTGRKSKEYAPHKTQGSQLLNDFWMGATANPRFLGVDLKMFFYQPSLIGLHIFMMAFAEYQYVTYGRLTTNMILLQIFEFGYFFVHYVKEDFMLSTWDFLAENFGFMLVWGDTAYLPFLYGLPGWFISDKEETLQGFNLILLVIVHVVFHYIFRSANFQKYDFRRNGMKARIWGAEPQTIEGKLLINGWWGIGRHLNYTGEIIVYLTFALCCGTTSIIPYLLPISVLSLLVQRAGRDDRRCREKYGAVWDKYCAKAKFMVIPYIY